MRVITFATSLLGIVTSLITAIWGYHVTYDINSRGTIPPKQIYVDAGPYINPFYDLTGIGNSLYFHMTINGKDVKNLIVVPIQFINTGVSPILPGDIFENLGLNALPPWKIVGVSNIKDKIIETTDNNIVTCEGCNTYTPRAPLNVTWNQIGDDRIEIRPSILINPGDIIQANVYLTNPEAKPLDAKSTPFLNFNGRVLNMQNFTYSNSNGSSNLQGREYSTYAVSYHHSIDPEWYIIIYLLLFSWFSLCYIVNYQYLNLSNTLRVDFKILIIGWGFIINLSSLYICALFFLKDAQQYASDSVPINNTLWPIIHYGMLAASVINICAIFGLSTISLIKWVRWRHVSPAST